MRHFHLCLSLLFFFLLPVCYGQKPSYEFLDEYNFKEVPLKDTVLLNEQSQIKPLLIQHKLWLKLGKVLPEDNLMKIKVGVAYRLNLSDHFKTLVFRYYHKVKQGMFSVLVNYTPEYDLIDYKLLSYRMVDTMARIGEAKIERNFLSIMESEGKSRDMPIG